MKQCPTCGSQMPDEALNCTNCGTALQDAQAAQQPYQQQSFEQQPYQQQPYQQQPYQQQPYQQQAYQQPKAPLQPTNPADKGKAVASLVCGIIGLLFGTIGSCISCICTGATMTAGALPSLIVNLIGLAICIVGIVLGVKARNVIPDGAEGRSLATAGLVCSIIATVLVGISVVCYGCQACTQGALCASGSSYNSLYDDLYKDAYNSYNW